MFDGFEHIRVCACDDFVDADVGDVVECDHCFSFRVAYIESSSVSLVGRS